MGAIVGGAIGGVALLAIVVLAVTYWYLKRRGGTTPATSTRRPKSPTTVAGSPVRLGIQATPNIQMYVGPREDEEEEGERL